MDLEMMMNKMLDAAANEFYQTTAKARSDFREKFEKAVNQFLFEHTNLKSVSVNKYSCYNDEGGCDIHIVARVDTGKNDGYGYDDDWESFVESYEDILEEVMPRVNDYDEDGETWTYNNKWFGEK